MNHNRNTGRDIAVIVAGIAAGILGSRLLPPLLLSANASRRARQGRDPFELLIDDHRMIQSLLKDMAQQTSETSTARRGANFLMLKRKLAKHALAEEDVVYPLLHNQAAATGQSKHLYDEHADIKILLYEIEQCVKNGTDWSGPVERLRTLVNGHIREEEEEVFPSLRQTLGGERLPAVSGQISREEAMVL